MSTSVLHPFEEEIRRKNGTERWLWNVRQILQWYNRWKGVGLLAQAKIQSPGAVWRRWREVDGSFEGWGHQVDRGVSESGGVGLGSGAALLGWACTFGFRLRMPVAYSLLSLSLSFSAVVVVVVVVLAHKVSSHVKFTTTDYRVPFLCVERAHVSRCSPAPPFSILSRQGRKLQRADRGTSSNQYP